MALDRDRVAEMLDRTLDDRRLSRGERHAIGEVFAELALSEDERAAVRNLAFERAEAALPGAAAAEVLAWLREVIKSLDQATRPDRAPVRSELYVSPGTKPLERICQLLRSARDSVDVCVFTITDNRISRELHDAHERGVRVRIISDDDKSLDQGSDIRRLAELGVPTVLDGSGHMHHKFAVFDRARVVCGSYNWTRAAAGDNHEDLVVSDDPGLVAGFRDEFERLWGSYGGAG
ncbi:phospholipase D-like domain-containing protein [Haliangium sp.]|uniref:phospholipase D-like domain-containing protein n=1 Tax=Haliangium sp. TaxID=2663208 RepID=UPI003D1305CE